MKKTPNSIRFSVVTCTWNSISTLADTIKSVQSQLHQNFEQIFVDGGSTDGTLELIAEMSPNSKILRNVTGGISRAMNAGISEATGDVLVHLHSDDFFADEKALSSVAEVFVDDSVSWAIGDFDYLVNNNREKGSQVFPLTISRLGLGNYIPHTATFIRTAVFKNEPKFNEMLKLCMDYELWFRLFSKQIPVYIPKVLSVFRAHNGSVSTSNRRATLREEMKVRFQYWNVSPWTLPRYLYRFAKRWHRNKLV